MTHKQMRGRRAAMLLAVLLLVIALGAGLWNGRRARAAESASYVLGWSVVGGGGGSAGSAGYQLNGTAGQPAAGPPQLASARYSLNSGYWYALRMLFLSLVQR